MRFPEFHGEWEKCKLGELAVKVGSGSTPKGGNAVYTTSGHCFVRSQNVGMGHLILNDIDWGLFENADKDTKIAAFTPIKYGMCWYE